MRIIHFSEYYVARFIFCFQFLTGDVIAIFKLVLMKHIFTEKFYSIRISILHDTTKICKNHPYQSRTLTLHNDNAEKELTK